MSKPRRVLVRCGHCGGRGEVELAPAYRDTLMILRRKADGFTGADLAGIVQIRATAMNNRLAGLERLGLATSRVEGRRRIYVATKEQP